jgi:hypothetical protein
MTTPALLVPEPETACFAYRDKFILLITAARLTHRQR